MSSRSRRVTAGTTSATPTRPLQGQALNDALAAIGRANPKQLAGVFERTDFNNKMALPSDDLARIVEHFHRLGPLDSTRVSDRHARTGLRVADRQVRGGLRQGRRRVLHAGRGRQADGRRCSSRSEGDAHLRPDLRVGRPAAPVPRPRAASRA